MGTTSSPHPEPRAEPQGEPGEAAEPRPLPAQPARPAARLAALPGRLATLLAHLWNALRRRGEPPPGDRKSLGAAGEDAAAAFLKKSGFTILSRNYTCRRGEIDIIALDGRIVCFIEVKTRGPDPLLPPERNVTPAKKRRIRSVARHYLQSRRLLDSVCRFDVVSVILPESGTPEIELKRHAF